MTNLLDLPILKAIDRALLGHNKSPRKQANAVVIGQADASRSLSPFLSFVQSRGCPPFVRHVVDSIDGGLAVSGRLGRIHITTTFVTSSQHNTTVSRKDVTSLWRVLDVAVPALCNVLPIAAASLHMDIVIMLTPIRKRFPSSGEDRWLPEHINTGVSLVSAASGLGTNILVYRREEFIKVTLHELLHCFGADAQLATYTRAHPSVCRNVETQARVMTRDLRLGEAYVEAYAVLCYGVVAAHISGQPATRLIAQQIARALRVMTDAWRDWQGSGRLLREETPVFAYLFAKAALLMDGGAALLRCPPSISSAAFANK